MKFFFIFSLLIASIQASIAEIPFESLNLKIQRSMLKCPDKVWPGYRPLEEGQIVIAYPSKKIAHLLKSDGSVEITPIERWGGGVNLDYELAVREGIRTSLINVERYESEEEALETLFHESFHLLGQTKLPKAEGMREDLMPIDLQARVARAMQIRNMMAHVKERKAGSLERAKFWESWIKLHRSQDWKDNQYTDVLEGGAQYAGIVSLAIGDLGCDASEDAIMEHVLEGTTKEGIDFRVGQSYTAGFYGYLSARMEKLNEVFEDFNSSPVTLMTQHCDEEKEEEDLTTYKKFDEKFGEFISAVKVAETQFKSKAHVLALPWDSVEGSYQAMGFFKVEVEGQVLGLKPDARLMLADSNGKISLHGRDLWESPEQVCGRPGDKMMLISIVDGSDIPSDAKNIYGHYSFVESGTLHGKKLFCPK